MLPPWLARSFAALRIPAYRTYWFALLASFGAIWFGFVARGYLVFDLTGSNAALGGIFIWLFVGQLGGRSLLPVNDPALDKALHHHVH